MRCYKVENHAFEVEIYPYEETFSNYGVKIYAYEVNSWAYQSRHAYLLQYQR